MNNPNHSRAQEMPAQAHQPRESRKQKLLFPAVCCTDDGKSRLDCTIRELSKTGARISFPRGSQMAETVHLINVRDMLVYEARLVWKNESEAGLAFTSTRTMSEITGPENAYLRRYWFERAMR